MGIGTYCHVWCGDMKVAICMGGTTTMQGNKSPRHTEVQLLASTIAHYLRLYVFYWPVTLENFPPRVLWVGEIMD